MERIRMTRTEFSCQKEILMPDKEEQDVENSLISENRQPQGGCLFLCRQVLFSFFFGEYKV